MDTEKNKRPSVPAKEGAKNLRNPSLGVPSQGPPAGMATCDKPTGPSPGSFIRLSTESMDSLQEFRELLTAQGSGDSDPLEGEKIDSSEEETLLAPPQEEKGPRAGPSGEGTANVKLAPPFRRANRKRRRSKARKITTLLQGRQRIIYYRLSYLRTITTNYSPRRTRSV